MPTFSSPNGEFDDDQTLTIVESESSQPNGMPHILKDSKPKIILHRQVGRLEWEFYHKLNAPN